MLHLANLDLVGVTVGDLAVDAVLVGHELKLVCQVANIPIELRHILVQIKGEHRGFQHGLLEDCLRFEVQSWTFVGVLHFLVW